MRMKVSVEESAGGQVDSDRELIMLVLQNLVGNSVKYSVRGTIVVFASKRQDPVWDGWEIHVADQGPGISPQNRERMFEAFSRGETHGQPGVGLGLAIAAQAARLLGGRLTFESEIGVGSTFHFSLPGMR